MAESSFVATSPIIVALVGLVAVLPATAASTGIQGGDTFRDERATTVETAVREGYFRLGLTGAPEVELEECRLKIIATYARQCPGPGGLDYPVRAGSTVDLTELSTSQASARVSRSAHGFELLVWEFAPRVNDALTEIGSAIDEKFPEIASDPQSGDARALAISTETARLLDEFGIHTRTIAQYCLSPNRVSYDIAGYVLAADPERGEAVMSALNQYAREYCRFDTK